MHVKVTSTGCDLHQQILTSVQGGPSSLCRLQGHLRAACQRLVGSPGWIPNPAIMACSLRMASITLLHHSVGDSRLPNTSIKGALEFWEVTGPLSTPPFFSPVFCDCVSRGCTSVGVELCVVEDDLGLLCSSQCWIAGVHGHFLCYLSFSLCWPVYTKPDEFS